MGTRSRAASLRSQVNISKGMFMKTNSNKHWRQRNREKVRAHVVVNHYLRTGRLVRQPCQECGAEPAHAHHEDYDKPLSITWLCSRCHRQLHAIERGQQLHPVRQRLTPRLDWHKKYQPSPVRDALLEEARELRASGLSYRQIGIKLGVSRGTIYKWLNTPDYH